ncbi:histidine--tRNA ligase, cytoplasmic-like [Phragmites australis]|uniref:histidine--tRNA ligase, cytoplasmic-like n=1 Tax=Phragmites australis TaxID=29695 RepID=UPI002D770358|nr:histidine--tRNA ligase, cytoplasmic-like [Phragmites australis]
MACAAAAAVTLGGKGAALSPAAVYALSLGLVDPAIDPSALQRLSTRAPSPQETPASLRALALLAPPESRAAASVLLNKLLLTAADSPSALVTAATATRLAVSLDLAAALPPGSRDEAAVAAASAPVAVALAAVIDCCAAPLARVADAVAALSCEAARGDAAAFDVPASGDGLSAKDEADVAADIKMLVFGSKLVGSAGGASAATFSKVPAVNGIFREAVRALHARVRIELNSPVKLGKRDAGGTGEGKEEALVVLATQLARSVQAMCKLSVARAKLCAEKSINDAELREKLIGGTDVDDLKGMLDKVMIDSDAVSVLKGVYNHLLKFRDFLAWEAAVAMAAIEMDNSIEKPQAGVENEAGSSTEKPQAGGEKAKGDRKSKKKKTLGKGTSAILMLLRDHVTNGSEVPSVNSKLVAEWGTTLSLLFDPKCPKLESLVEKVKEIVESNEVRRLPKIPKGTRDFGKEQMAIRERAFSIITGVFKMHGATALDTPVFELRETLMGKYGEDSKLIYDLADQGGELCSLRYDLTVPFARYVAMNNISALKRYQIAKVYRRDNPSKGRYREFYQCDFDIAGVYEPMEPDFEVIKVLTELLDQLDIGTYEIKLNHRKLLDGMLEICGVPAEKFRTVCSSIDKLDKQTFEQVKKELVDEKGISNETAEEIGNLVKTRGPPLEVLLELRKEGSKLMENEGSVVALNELEILFKALEKANATGKIVFDLSLARGLDYYTGVIYEAVFKGATQVGSIAAGGRYDNLAGMFSGKQVPAVGVSLGIERVFAIMEQQEKERHEMIRATETEVLVSILGKDLILAAELVSELWNAGIKAEFKLTTRVQNHIKYATQSGIPWMVLVGEAEIQKQKLKLKNIRANQEEEVDRKDFAQELKKRLSKP